MRIKNLVLTCCFIIFYLIAYSQTYTSLNCGFTIIEKREEGKKNSLIIGQLNFDDSKNETKFDIQFPQKEKWVIADTILHKYKGDTLLSTSVIGNVNEQMFFKQLLSFKGSDYGLSEFGFTMSDVEEVGNGLINVSWSPPANVSSFIKSAHTQVKDNLLQSVSVIDVDGLVLNETYFEEYAVINGLPVPVIVSMKVATTKEVLYKKIKLRDVEIE